MSTINALSEDLKRLVVEYSKPYYLYNVYIIECLSQKTHPVGNFDSLKKAIDCIESDILIDKSGIRISNVCWIDNCGIGEKFCKTIQRTEINTPAINVKSYDKLPDNLDE